MKKIIYLLIIFLPYNCLSQKSCGTVKDFDGNFYKTVQIGSQCWLAENLKVTHYSNGDAVLNIIDSIQWKKLTIGAYCNYNNKSKNTIKYGRLYNWYAVVDRRNICPTGWCIPTENEYQQLINHLGGEEIAGIKMQTTKDWSDDGFSINPNGTNKSGFSGLPGGRRMEDGTFINIDAIGDWWIFNEYNRAREYALMLELTFLYTNATISDESKKSGFSVRCIKCKK